MAQAKGALALTVGFGVAFLNLLWYFGRHIGFGPGRYAYGVVIFAMMTFVGVAVVAGIVALLATLARVTGAQVAGDDAEMARAAAWYWDFVAVAWIVLAYVIWTP
jgi:heme/copper-type cytochrome/quinol oxidase subunit 3